jgi:superfamily I DNA/RNA helicase
MANVASGPALRSPSLIVGSAHQTLRRIFEIDVPAVPDEDYWDSDFLEAVEDRITSPEYSASAKFDYLVIDEAQDLLARPRLFACIGQLLVGGLESGSVVLFGDLDRQVLTDRGRMQRMLADLSSPQVFTRWLLDENCRNLRVIGETALRLSGFPTDVYSEYVRGNGTHADIDYVEWKSVQDHDEQLKTILREFNHRGYKNKDITLVSFCGVSASAGPRLASAGWSLAPAKVDMQQIGYASACAFKGMENRVVIITDLKSTGASLERELFYTAMTRATDCVRVLAHETSMEEIHNWLRGRNA